MITQCVSCTSVRRELVGDGICNEDLNTPECCFDAGDCGVVANLCPNPDKILLFYLSYGVLSISGKRLISPRTQQHKFQNIHSERTNQGSVFEMLLTEISRHFECSVLVFLRT